MADPSPSTSLSILHTPELSTAVHLHGHTPRPHHPLLPAELLQSLPRSSHIRSRPLYSGPFKTQSGSHHSLLKILQCLLSAHLKKSKILASPIEDHQYHPHLPVLTSHDPIPESLHSCLMGLRQSLKRKLGSPITGLRTCRSLFLELCSPPPSSPREFTLILQVPA